MTEINKKELNTINRTEKIEKANCDIKKIDELLADSSMFHYNSDDFYNELSRNFDYAPFIFSATMAKGMLGNTPFRALPYYQKRRVFAVIQEAIRTYISKELTDKICGDENAERN